MSRTTDSPASLAFEKYRAWLNEWREVARASFTRRDYLISLGLASRRSGDDTDGDADESDAPTPRSSAA